MTHKPECQCYACVVAERDGYRAAAEEAVVILERVRAGVAKVKASRGNTLERDVTVPEPPQEEITRHARSAEAAFNGLGGCDERWRNLPIEEQARWRKVARDVLCTYRQWRCP